MTPMKTLATALALSTALTTSAFAATKVGVIGAANPQVYATGEDGTERLLNIGDAIFLNDKLRTDGKGSAQLMFLDKSALTISPESVVMIDKFVYDPAAKDGAMTLNGAKGAFRFIGGALTKKKAVNIKTPVSTIGIRGGIVDTHIEPSGETDALFLFGKEMTMTNGAGETTSTTSFGTGLGLANAASVPVSLPQNIVAQRISRSPTQAAVSVAPASNPNSMNTINNKIGTTGGAANKAATGGAAPAGNTGSGNAPAPTNNNGGGNQGGTSGGASNTNGAATPPTASNNNTGGAQQPAANGAPTQAPTNSLNSAAATTMGGLAEGSGMKPMVDAPVDTSDADSNLQENQRAKIKETVNAIDAQLAALGSTVTAKDLIAGNKEAAQFINAAANQPQKTADTTQPTNTTTSPLLVNNILSPTPSTDGTLPPPPPPTGTTGDGGQLPPPPEGTNTAGDGGTTGGGTGGTNTGSNTPPPPPPPPGNGAPTYTPYSIASGNENAVFPNRSLSITDAELLANITDPDSDVLTIVSGTVNVVNPSHGTLTGPAGNYTLNAKDIAPGEARTITIQYQVTDGTNYVNVARNIQVTGTDMFGNAVAWDTSAPSISAPTHSGGFGFKAIGNGAIKRDGVVKAKFDNGPNKNYVLGKDTYVDGNYVGGGTDGAHYLAIKTPSTYANGSPLGTDYQYSHSISSDLAADGYVVETENGEVPLTGGTGRSIANDAFEFHALKWHGQSGTDKRYLRYYQGESTLMNSGIFHATQATANSLAQAAYDDMITDSELAAISKTTAGIPVINYSFLPDINVDLDSAGNDEFGMFSYNAFAQFSNPMYGSMVNAPTRYGLLVDYEKEKFYTGFVDFTGTVAGSPGIAAAFGDVLVGTDAPISADVTNGGIDDSTYAFHGDVYGWTIDDLDVSGTYGPGEISVENGTTYVNANELYNDIDTADSPITAMILRGDTTNVSYAQGAVADNKADSLVDMGADDFSHKGYTGGLIFQDNGTLTKAARIAGTVEVNLPAISGDVDAQISYVLKDTAFSAGSTRLFGTGISGKNAAIQKDMYAAADNLQDNLIVAPGSNSDTVVCNSCEFAHWGVWATNFANTNSVDTTGLVPYVAGQKTTNAELATYVLTSPGNVTYSGDAAGNFIINNSTMTNEIGSFSAVIDMNNRKISTGNFAINFNDIAGNGNRDLTMTNTAGEIYFTSSNALDYTFTTGDVSYTDSSGAQDILGEGAIKGAFFGPTAEEVGGNFYVDSNTANASPNSPTPESIKGGGIYLGKR